MKRIIALLLIAIMVFNLIGCGGANVPKGKYTGYIGNTEFATLVFSGKDKVALETSSKTSEGTFTMNGNTVKISFNNGNSDTMTYNAEDDILEMPGVVFRKK